MPEFSEVLYEVAAQVATITIDREERRSALSWGVIGELRRAFATAKAIPTCGWWC